MKNQWLMFCFVIIALFVYTTPAQAKCDKYTTYSCDAFVEEGNKICVTCRMTDPADTTKEYEEKRCELKDPPPDKSIMKSQARTELIKKCNCPPADDTSTGSSSGMGAMCKPKDDGFTYNGFTYDGK